MTISIAFRETDMAPKRVVIPAASWKHCEELSTKRAGEPSSWAYNGPSFCVSGGCGTYAAMLFGPGSPLLAPGWNLALVTEDE